MWGAIKGAAGAGAKYAGIYGKMAGLGLAKTALGGYGHAAQGAVIGGAAGGVYGMFADNTSMIGGAMMGAGMGAVGNRYGRAALSGAVAGWGRGGGYGYGRTAGAMRNSVSRAGRMIRRDAKMAANQAINAFNGLSAKFQR